MSFSKIWDKIYPYIVGLLLAQIVMTILVMVLLCLELLRGTMFVTILALVLFFGLMIYFWLCIGGNIENE